MNRYGNLDQDNAAINAAILRPLSGSFDATLRQFFVDDVLGDDTNDGSAFGAGAALKTPQEAVDRLPELIASRVEIIMLPHAGSGYPAPQLGSRTIDSATGKVTFVGDGFIEVQAPRVSVTADAAKVVDPIGGLGVDVRRAFTLEFTDGAAIGYRRTVHSNDATDILFSIDTDISGAVVPSDGDSYRIVRPAVRWDVSAGLVANDQRLMASRAEGSINYVNIGFDDVGDIQMSIAWKNCVVNFYGCEHDQPAVRRYDWEFSLCIVGMGTESVNGSTARTPVDISAPYGNTDTAAWAGWGIAVTSAGVGGPFSDQTSLGSSFNAYCTNIAGRVVELFDVYLRWHGGNMDGIFLFGRTGPRTSLFASTFGTNAIKMHSTDAVFPCLWLSQVPGIHVDLIGLDFDHTLLEVLRVEGQAEIFEGCSTGKGQSGLSIQVEGQGRLLNFGAITIGDAVALDLVVAGAPAFNKGALTAKDQAVSNAGSVITRAFF